jgi:hypothetical protein
LSNGGFDFRYFDLPSSGQRFNGVAAERFA